MSDLEVKMTIKTLARKGIPKRAIARQLNLSEGTVRYHLTRMDSGAADGRARQRQSAEGVAKAIAYWRSSAHALDNTAALHESCWRVVGELLDRHLGRRNGSIDQIRQIKRSN